MVWLHVVVRSRVQACNSGHWLQYHLQSASHAFFATKLSVWAEMCPSDTHYNSSTPSWHQSLGLELSLAACRRGHLISSFDVWSDAWLEVQGRFAGGIRATKFCTSGISACRVRDVVGASHIKTWAENCVSQHWKFACYIMSLPHERWVRRMLYWQPCGRGPVGRPAMHWASKFEESSVGLIGKM